MKILIADDDSVIRKFVSNILTEYGDCDLAVNGKEAVDVFEAAYEAGSPYDFVCLDIVMPVMGGLDALVTIREYETYKGVRKGEAAKVLIMTSLMDGSKSNMAYKLGCDAFCRKPMSKAKLEQVMKDTGLLLGDE